MIKVKIYSDIYEFKNRNELKSFLSDANLYLDDDDNIISIQNEGVIPRILDKWFSKRVEYRKLESEFGKKGDMEKYNFYNKRQTTQKILLNSLYGVLGLQSFRFFDIDNAEAVTTTGRDIILNTAKMINIKYNKELGGLPIKLEMEDGTDIQVYPNSKVKIKRNNTEIEILAKELEEGDDFICRL